MAAAASDSGVAGDQQRLRPGIARQLQRQKADHATAKDRNPMAGHHGGQIKPVQRASKRFAKCAMMWVQGGGQGYGLAGRKADEGRKAAIAGDAGTGVALTQIDAATLAGLALKARIVRVTCDAQAHGQADAGAGGGDDAGELMAEGDGRGARKLTLKQVPVGAADARSLHPDQHFAGAGCGGAVSDRRKSPGA